MGMRLLYDCCLAALNYKMLSDIRLVTSSNPARVTTIFILFAHIMTNFFVPPPPVESIAATVRGIWDVPKNLLIASFVIFVPQLR